jgi:hypothetical protein
MNKRTLYALVVGLGAIVIGGCDPGNQPASPSPDEIKKTIAAMPADKQIEMIQHSPMSPQQKEQKIAEIKAKAGMK